MYLSSTQYFVFVKDSGCNYNDPNPYPVIIDYTESFSVNLIDQIYNCQTEFYNNVFSLEGDNISFPLSVDVTNLSTGNVINLNSNEDVISIDQLESGLYDISVTSDSGCQDNYTFVVNDYNQLEVLFTTPSQSMVYSGFGVSCNSANDGWINSEVSGGFGNYTYSWSNGESSSDISNFK